MYYYIRGWGFAAVVFTVIIIISSSFLAQVARDGPPDAIEEIGKILGTSIIQLLEIIQEDSTENIHIEGLQQKEGVVS